MNKFKHEEREEIKSWNIEVESTEPVSVRSSFFLLFKEIKVFREFMIREMCLMRSTYI